MKRCGSNNDELIKILKCCCYQLGGGGNPHPFYLRPTKVVKNGVCGMLPPFSLPANSLYFCMPQIPIYDVISGSKVKQVWVAFSPPHTNHWIRKSLKLYTSVSFPYKFIHVLEPLNANTFLCFRIFFIIFILKHTKIWYTLFIFIYLSHSQSMSVLLHIQNKLVLN